MKFTAIFLIALLALTSVKADTNTDAANCIASIPKPCGVAAQDSACAKAYLSFGICVAYNCASKSQNLGDYASCLNSSCKSDNDKVQNYIDEQVSCVYGALLSLTALILATFAFLF
ncbi:transmembrane protein, putative (macronuclear) [Tetrahymena thermophila SB210]|uniref:Transmembrane protein, putative n=1 Tax=Tetrahymena thermophila (strain SB210) TaxID=312017 RepID=Q23M97_TETTS|nr:transmembrane protein, putative [Tetrahymena thermophila SB210]EAR97742.1 transmembrane protein, putative [Tetrahymena thermophila SB210]|eukprot:XP_001017987.1 transmembrane protein, putative [Tetrahymena thermophila SB210]